MISLLNVLNFVSILLSVIFQILLIRSFGATLQTDAYYLTIGIIQFVNALFVGFTTDLFIPVYNEVKNNGKQESLQFTGAVFLFIAIIGSILAVIAFIIAPLLVKVFASGFTADKILFTANLIKILSVTILFSALNGLLIAALNANLFMTITYTSAIITPALNNLALIFFSKAYGVNALAFSIAMGSLLTFLLLFMYHLKKIGWRFNSPMKNKDIAFLLRKNVILRVGHLINALKGPLTTNVLSYFPVGYITLFSYTDKILNIIFRITNSPMLSLLFVKASNFLATKKMGEIKYVVKSALKSNFVLFIFILLPTIILFKKIFGVIFINRFTSAEIGIMYCLFLCLVPYYLTLSLEMPFTYITIAMKRGGIIAKIASASLILYALILLFGKNIFAIYSIPIAMSFAQLFNTAAYTKFVNHQLDIFDKEIVKAFILNLTIGIVLVLINYLTRNNFIAQLCTNFIIVCIWLIFAGQDIVMTFRLFTRRGEIK